jgi:hypothetical protein
VAPVVGHMAAVPAGSVLSGLVDIQPGSGVGCMEVVPPECSCSEWNFGDYMERR